MPLILYRILWEARRGASRVVVGRPNGKNYLEDLGIDGRVLLKWIVQKWDEEAWTGLICRKERTGGGLCECGDGPPGSIKCGRSRD
jgi:hypothetical protein